MREIQASEGKAHIGQLLDEVEGGETMVIIRHRGAIARLALKAQRRQGEIDRAIELKTKRLMSARHEGHKC